MRIVLPLEVYTSKSQTKKSKFILNLNNYRNTHFFKLNKAKQEYSEIVKGLIGEDVEQLQHASLTFTYYPKTKRRVDVSNPCSVIDKFTCDALTEIGLIEDDNVNFIKDVRYTFGGVDKENPRCELIIKEKK